MYSMILALGLAPGLDVPDCRVLAARSSSRAAVSTQAGGCSGRSAPGTYLAVPAAAAAPAPTGCSGSFGVRSRVRFREVDRFRGRGVPAVLVVPACPPPATLQAPPATMPPPKKDPGPGLGGSDPANREQKLSLRRG